MFNTLEKKAVLRIMYQCSSNLRNPQSFGAEAMLRVLQVDDKFLADTKQYSLTDAVAVLVAMTENNKLEFAKFVLNYKNETVMHPSQMEMLYPSLDSDELLVIYNMILVRKDQLSSADQIMADHAAKFLYNEFNALIAAFKVSNNQLNSTTRTQAEKFDEALKKFKPFTDFIKYRIDYVIWGQQAEEISVIAYSVNKYSKSLEEITGFAATRLNSTF